MNLQMRQCGFGLLNFGVLFVLLGVSVAPPPDGRGGGGGGGPMWHGGGPHGGGPVGHFRGPSSDQSPVGGPQGGRGRGHGPPDDKQGGPRGNGKGWGPRRRLSDEGLQALQATCRGRGNCKGKSEKAQKTRNAVKQSLRGNGRGMDDATIEVQLQKTLQAKKVLFEVNGLTDVEPHDNGLIGGDMVLSIDQLDKIIDTAKGVANANETLDPVPFLEAESLTIPSNITRRKRGDMLALDYYSGNKWPTTTIHFYISPTSFTATQANVIRAALKSISSVSCIKFVEGWTYPLIEYLKTPAGTDEGTCGWASVGYQGNYNSVHINFASYTCGSTIKGVVVHETLHTLGFSHEHTRYDRDRYLKIYWANVDPQSYDVYDKDNPHDYTPYCIGFDPLSTMQYDAYVAAIDSDKPAMAPHYYADYYIPRMGQAIVMSSKDAQLLNKMYCRSATCHDKSTNCGWTACTDCTKYGAACPRSCGKC